MPGLAAAQVTVNPAALRQLAGLPVAAPAPAPIMQAAPARRVPSARRRKNVILAVARPPSPVASATPKPAISPVVAPVIAPVIAPVAKAQAPQAVPPPAPAAILFAAGSAALPAGAAARLKPFCEAPGDIIINAYAPGDAGDPSAAMRLSLARAMAVRGALLACGVPGQNILPRALGAAARNNNAAEVGSQARG